MIALLSAVLALASLSPYIDDAQTVHKPGPGITLPTVVRAPKPAYTEEAKRAGIQGEVHLLLDVQTDGTVANVRVVRSLDKEYGLDEQAVKAVHKWQFKPGTKDGQPVPVEITVEMTFRLK